ncbi:hypothetical protein DsansV1_C27g0199711 [Dioscorea sansibarensis]
MELMRTDTLRWETYWGAFMGQVYARHQCEDPVRLGQPAEFVTTRGRLCVAVAKHLLPW